MRELLCALARRRTQHQYVLHARTPWGFPPAHIGINAVFLQPQMGGLDTRAQALVPELVHAAPNTRFSLFVSDAGRRYVGGRSWVAGVELMTHPLLGRPGLKAASELALLGALADRAGMGSCTHWR